MCDIERSIDAGARAITARFTAVPFDALDEDVRSDALDEARVVLEAVNHPGAVEALEQIAEYHEHGRHSAVTPANLAGIARRALDRLGGR